MLTCTSLSSGYWIATLTPAVGMLNVNETILPLKEYFIDFEKVNHGSDGVHVLAKPNSLL